MALKKVLNLNDVFAICTGAMISSGLFVLPGIAFAKAGPAMILSYLLASLLIIPSMLAKAELSTAMPKAGGTYFYIDRSLGPVIGTFGGFANWFSLSLKSAFALIGIGAFAVLIHPGITPFHIKLIAAVACLFFMAMNISSVKATGRIQIILVYILLMILILYVGRGFIATHPDRYIPFAPYGFWPVVSTAGLVFISFGGLTKISSIAEEVKNPTRNIPLGMALSFITVSFLYLLSIGVTVGIVPGEELSGSMTPISTGAGHLTGNIGAVLLAIAAITAFVTTANAGILSASRSPLAMSRDQLLPGFISKLHARFGTPHISILMTSSFMILVIMILSIEDLVKTASTLMILLFMMDNVALIVMRESKVQNYRPKFKMPLYPWLPILALVSYGFLLIEMGKVPLMICGIFFLTGSIFYRFYSRDRVNRTSALTHLVKRITAKELKTRSLEKELREIVFERDEIIEDRFDLLIKNCEILDLESSMRAEEAFEHISAILSKRLNIEKKILFDAFMQREKQSATVIKPGLAIPHIIIPGEKQFEILLVRCREGLQFSCVPDPVITMFVLAGSMDERNYHLRALMAIAYTVQETGFQTKWCQARNVDELRDVILLSSRKRDH